MDIRRAVFSEEAASRLSVSNLRGKAYIPPMFDVSKISWICRGRDVVCGPRTLIMGILNVTPDSFSDGGKFQSLEKAVAHGLQMVADGADVIDLGGESTPPLFPLPFPDLREETDVLISIDTQKAAVAQAALDAGADIVNDVSALADPDMAGVVSGSGAGLILMHMRGIPRTMQRDPRYDDVVSNVRNFLQERMALAMNHGVLPEQLVLDPGIGFGKTDEHNLALLNGIPALAGLGRPVMVGVSRKSLIGRLLGREPDERLAGSLALAVFSILNGARLLRVHDVKESCDAARLSDRMRAQGINDGLVEQN